MIGHMTYFIDFSLFEMAGSGPEEGHDITFYQIFLVGLSLEVVSELVFVNKYAQVRVFTEDLPIGYGDLIRKNNYRHQLSGPSLL